MAIWSLVFIKKIKIIITNFIYRALFKVYKVLNSIKPEEATATVQCIQNKARIIKNR